VAFEESTGRGGRPDVILVDTTWNNIDFLAYQLARRGLGVHAFTPRLRRPRYLRFAYPYRSYVEQPLENGSHDSFRAMAERIEPAYIIPCSEEALYWLWDQPGHIQRLCFPDVAPAVRPLLLDRALLLEQAAAWGVPVPAGVQLGSRADCDEAIAAGLPLMVKSGQSVGSRGIALCRTPGEVIEAFERFAPLGASVTAQRFYTGPTYMAGALFVHGEAVHFYSGEKTIMWPKLTGYAYEIRSSSEPYLSQLLQYAETVCKQLEWTGFAGMDFVLGEDGEFRFLDFNPRLWGAASAAPSAGVDLYGGLARWIRDGTAGPPSRPLSGISHRVFPKYTFEPSGMSLWQRLGGLRDAPWDEPSLVIGEAIAELRARAGERIRAWIAR
jgi:ATP-grasp domain